MRILYEGELGYGVTAKDLILGTIGRIGTDGGVGHVIEYAGPPIERLSMEGRMTVCNMTIEGGGRAGMIAPDDTTFEWVEGREAAPDPLPLDEWRELRTDAGAAFDKEVVVDAVGALAAGHLGHQRRAGRRRHRRRARAVRRERGARARVHGARAGHADRRRSRSTASSSARARTRGSATCARRPRWSTAARWPPASRRWSCPARSR